MSSTMRKARSALAQARGALIEARRHEFARLYGHSELYSVTALGTRFQTERRGG